MWFIVAILLCFATVGQAGEDSVTVPQEPILGSSIDKYVDPLPTFYPDRVAAGSNLTISYEEFQQNVLPDAFYSTLAAPYNSGTYVWGYKVGSAPQLYPGFTVEAQKGTPTQVTYLNHLGTATTPPYLQQYLTIDQSIHWANPLNAPKTITNPSPPYDIIGNPFPYVGPHPVVPHLHGGEVRSDSDGGPEQWWTPGAEGPGDGPLPAGTYRGMGYSANGNVYSYPNTQQATTLWFHDHMLGATRLNVYAGLAAFYFLRDEYDTGVPDTGLDLPAGPYEVEIVIQDRQFDTNGQWYFPDGTNSGLNGPATNPLIHRYWNPEFFGDVIVVNGKSWPYLDVEPRRYRLRLLNGSNARFYELHMETHTGASGPPIYVIGSDGGLLDAPAITSSTASNRLIIAPGERYDVIVDFRNFTGQNLTLMNTANAPFPDGDPVDPATSAQIMQFHVSTTLVPDDSFNPAQPGAVLRGGHDRPPVIVRLADGTGGINPAVAISKKRQLTLREVEAEGGPEEVLVNNTKWNGKREGTSTPLTGSQYIAGNYLTELPQVGSSEVWEIINLTGDAHPIHLHLVQFQLVNRQDYNDVAYTAAYESAFPAGADIDGYGPPMNYNSTAAVGNPNYTGYYGGNPDVTPYLTGVVQAPLAHEAGWKDTVIMYPGQVTRIIVRWAPQDVAVAASTPGKNLYSFDPTKGPGYVWHCHILDHEDNEMMRPYIPTLSAYNLFNGNGSIGARDLLLLLD